MYVKRKIVEQIFKNGLSLNSSKNHKIIKTKILTIFLQKGKCPKNVVQYQFFVIILYNKKIFGNIFCREKL